MPAEIPARPSKAFAPRRQEPRLDPDMVTARRQLLQVLATAPVLTFSMTRSLRAQAAAAGLITTDVCLVQTEVTEGPFYIDPRLIRSDIVEGQTGAPMTLRLQVVDTDCAPISGARVDVWHCNAAGMYSGVENLGGGEDANGQTFLRGTQPTDATGVASFRTIYPGWYRGRTTHIHYKVFLDEATILTSQIFFDDASNDRVYAADAAYGGRGMREIYNSDDRIAEQAGDAAYCTLTDTATGLDAALVVGINPSARSGSLWDRLFGRA